MDQKLKGEIKKYLKTNKNQNTTYKNSRRWSKSSSKREIHSNKCPN